MAATIVVKRIDATLENGVWSCPDARLRQYLQAVLNECQRLDASASEDRLALLVSNRVGGARIPKVMPSAPVSPPPTGRG